MSEAVKAVRARLVAVPEVTAIVGQRIYSGLAPQGAAAPYVQLYTISGVQDRTLSGSIGRRVSRIQAEVWAPSREVSAAAIQAVFRALNDYRGGAIRNVAFANENDDYDEPTGLYGNRNDFLVTLDE